jgi:Leucine-rich repeat (LRR) protein
LKSGDDKMNIKNVLSLLTLTVLFSGSVFASPDFVPVCDRSPAAQDMIIRALRVSKKCHEVSENDVASIKDSFVSGNFRHGYNEYDTVSVAPFKDGDFSGLINVMRINISNYPYYTLPENLFKGLPGLKWLYIGYAYNSENEPKLEALPKGIFAGLTNLESIALLNSNITILPAEIFAGLNLFSLNLSSNQIETLPETIFSGLVNLRELNLTGNPLRSLGVGTFSGNPDIQFIYLNKTLLKTLPVNIFKKVGWFNKNQYIELVDLSENQIMDIDPQTFKGFEYLLNINMRNNPLSEQTKSNLRAVLKNKVKIDYWDK